MKNLSKILIPLLVFTTMLISACTGVAAPASGGAKVQAAPVEFTGVIESINGNQWVVNGQAITVDPAIVNDGPFNVGDTVKVEVNVQADGSILVTRVEPPSVSAAASEEPITDSSETAETSEASSTPDPSSGSSTPDPTSAGLVFDNSGTQAFGTVDSITVDTVVISGQSFTIANGAELKNQIQAGDFVKVHFSLNADGTMSVTEIETSDPALINEDNSSSNTGLDDNSNDDNGNDGVNHESNDKSDDNNEDNSNSGNDDNSGTSGGHD